MSIGKTVGFALLLCGLCLGSINGFKIDYYEKIQGWMTMHTNRVDWHTARTNCRMEGAFLASPWSEEFTEIVHELQQEHDEPVYVPQTVYSGLHTTHADGAFIFTNGVPTLLLNPKDLAATELCGVFFPNRTLGQVPCDQQLAYICYKPNTEVIDKVLPEPASEPTPEFAETEPTPEFAETEPTPVSEAAPALTVTTCGNMSLGYEFSEETGHCYKFHAQAAHTWEDAMESCEEEEAYLAIVNSDKEAAVLSKLFNEYPASRISNALYTDTAAIGFRYNEGNDDWETIDDQSLRDAGYNSWRPNAPGRGAMYGFIARDGLLYGYIQTKFMPFICEKNPTVSDIMLETTTNTEQRFEQEPEIGSSSSPEGLCGDVRLGYEIVEHQCYKYHEEKVLTMDDANTVCESEGAHLATSDKLEDAIVLVQIFQKQPPKQIDRIFEKGYGDEFVMHSFYDDYISSTEVTETTSQHAEGESGFVINGDRLYAYVLGSNGLGRFICKKESEEIMLVETGTKAESKPQVETETEPYIYSVTEAESEPQVETETEQYIYSVTQVESETERYNYSVTETEMKPQVETETEPYIYSVTEAESEPQVETETELYIYSVTETEIKPQVETETERYNYYSVTETESKPQVENESERYNYSVTETEIKPQVETETERYNYYSVTETESKPQVENESERYNYSVTETEIKPQVETETERYNYYSVTEAESKPQVENETERYNYSITETEIKPQVETETERYNYYSVTEAESKPQVETETELYIYSDITTERGLVLGNEPKPEFEPVLAPSPLCGDIDLGYEYAKKTGQCYKFHAQTVPTWYDTTPACNAEGASLAVVNSDVEAQVLTQLFAKYPAESIQGTRYTDIAAIGFYYTIFDSWLTIDGETLEEAGYSAWAPDAPNLRTKFGFLSRDGLLYGYPTTVGDVTYICEKKPIDIEAEITTVSKPVSENESNPVLPVETEIETETESVTESVTKSVTTTVNETETESVTAIVNETETKTVTETEAETYTETDTELIFESAIAKEWEYLWPASEDEPNRI